jgi:hypothetical protein
MSYDMSIGEEEFNYTYNVALMWYASEPELGIRAIYGSTGREAIPILRNMRAYMEEHWEDMKAMEPDNGWGDALGAYTFLNHLLIASAANPSEVWRGD